MMSPDRQVERVRLVPGARLREGRMAVLSAAVSWLRVLVLAVEELRQSDIPAREDKPLRAGIYRADVEIEKGDPVLPQGV